MWHWEGEWNIFSTKGEHSERDEKATGESERSERKKPESGPLQLMQPPSDGTTVSVDTEVDKQKNLIWWKRRINLHSGNVCVSVPEKERVCIPSYRRWIIWPTGINGKGGIIFPRHCTMRWKRAAVRSEGEEGEEFFERTFSKSTSISVERRFTIVKSTVVQVSFHFATSLPFSFSIQLARILIHRLLTCIVTQKQM